MRETFSPVEPNRVYSIIFSHHRYDSVRFELVGSPTNIGLSCGPASARPLEKAGALSAPLSLEISAVSFNPQLCRRLAKRCLPMSSAKRIPENGVRQLVIVLGTPMRINAIPTVALKDMITFWASPWATECQPGVTAQTMGWS